MIQDENNTASDSAHEQSVSGAAAVAHERSGGATQDVYILAIESSCDETAAAVVKNGRTVCSNIISSQVPVHTLYGGVVPEIASRKHVEQMNPVITQALAEAGMTLKEMTAIAVTYGPGLIGALLAGVSQAKAMAYATGLPLIPCHHIEGHIAANFISHPTLTPPFLCLIVSGGHTHLAAVRDYGVYEMIGRTHDDAAGEAFDKVARALSLGYPGGPKIDQAARTGNPNAIAFPRAQISGAPWDFSFSGLKSAVLNYLNQEEMKGNAISVPDVAASFQQAVVEVLVSHTRLAAKAFGYDKVALAGGVAANHALREAMAQATREDGFALYQPEPVLCTDNAAMIGAMAYYSYLQGDFADLDLNAYANLKIGERRFTRRG